jgi:hypothetical protein
MSKRSAAARTLAVAGLTLGLLGIAGPAQAERYSVDDPADASASLNDIYGLTLVHGEKRVRFVIDVDDLRPRSDAGATLYLDTDPADKGPEYALGTGLSSGTDYALVRIEGWNDTEGTLLGCDYDLRLKYRTDRVVGSIKRACLKRPDTVAAAVKMVDTADASHPVRDWAPGKKKFGLAVAAG